MITNKYCIAIIVILILHSSCTMKIGKLLFNGKNNEIVSTQEFKDYMKIHPQPSIVLRVPKSSNEVTKSDNNNDIYNAIEKELIIGGFNVKDRSLFNEVMNKNTNLNYSDVSKSTETDLILELSYLNTEIKHVTNRILNKKGIEKTYKNYTITRVGAAIEFKIIIVNLNKLAGSYLYNYTPCSKSNNEDCDCKISYKPHSLYPFINNCKQINKKSAEYIEQDKLVLFVRDGIKNLISDITK